MILRLLFACLAVTAVSGPVAAADPPVGRLFFTPGQRASLDIARSQRTRDTVATERTEQLVVEQPTPQTITYGGMVRRSDGQTTVWINDRAVHDQERPGRSTVIRRVGPDGTVTLNVPQSDRQVDLKVGQSVEVLSGSVGNTYQEPVASGKDKPPAAAPGSDAQKAPALDTAEPESPPTSERASDPGAAAAPGSR